METVQVENLRLGKQNYVPDDRTLMLAEYLDVDIPFPASWDFDTARVEFPLRVWGNNEYGDCVFAGRANHILRLERKEARYTPYLQDKDVIEEYKKRTGCQNPGDVNDRGYVVLNALKEWREGWTPNMTNASGQPIPPRNFQIAAFGEIDPQDFNQCKLATYLLTGTQYGLWLPLTALDQLREAIEQDKQCIWQVNSNAPATHQRPGTWGGHLVYAKKYSPDLITCLTWGMEVGMTEGFLKKYCDEAWAVVDALSPWRNRHEIDVDALVKKLRDIGAENIEGG